jgi:prepilin-type N-terminal cleavage/methylation domain-containing protein
MNSYPHPTIHASAPAAKNPASISGRGATVGFTLTESVIAIALGSLIFSGIYACFAWGFGTVRASRENLPATQIMLKHIESLRPCSFTQLTDTNYSPATFTDYYDPKDQSS